MAGQLARNGVSAQSKRKHRAIQEASMSVFLRLGYGSASMDLIAAELGLEASEAR